MSAHDVSFVMTVYNKEYYLPHVLKALLNQQGLKNPEFIFVDDVSTDNSVQLIREATKDLPHVMIVVNEKNMGISPTENKAIMLAKGEFVRMLDSDDILPIDSTSKMLSLAKKHSADMVYGEFRKTGKKPQDICDEKMSENLQYAYHPDALNTVLNGRFVRMGQLIKRDVLQKSGGADERIFIQDESIPVRSATLAQGVIKISEPVVLVPEEIGNFSGNKSQLNHDRFLVYYYMLTDKHKLPQKALRRMYVKAVSAYWKEFRASSKLPYLSCVFTHYLFVKLFKPLPSRKKLHKMKLFFDKLENIRRTPKHQKG
ncbi:MAG: glycosyltransferase family 2 protein [Alphaproteobacteria bacterium]|nr:glycosyltransferase family 2 protein [Alphaproteobacteria bacterium]